MILLVKNLINVHKENLREVLTNNLVHKGKESFCFVLFSRIHKDRLKVSRAEKTYPNFGPCVSHAV